jgi:hypothetical protein
VLSQIMARAVGRHWAYYVVSLTITLVLALAANTSFGGLPVLASLLSRDHYLPHLFSLRGDRQVFANGIWALAILSAVLLVAVNGNTNTMIPLFAIGVFIGFTLAQAGLVVHWWRSRAPRWQMRAMVNGLGAVVTAAATVIFLITKFTEGAWVVVVAIPGFILLFLRIRAYYQRVRQDLRLDEVPAKPAGKRTIVIVPITEVSRLTRYAISEALSLSASVTAVRVVLEEGGTGDTESQRLRAEWEQWNPGVPLVVLRTEYASVVDAMLGYIDATCQKHSEQVVVLIPTIIPPRLRYRLLHNHLDLVLSAALRSRPDVIVARVTMPLAGQPARAQPAPPAEARG